MSVRVFAPAKINLTLKVGGVRPDGLHPLQSVVVFADAGDVVTAEPGDELSLRIRGPFAGTLDAGEGNLVLRAARALAEAAKMDARGAALTLEKNLPVASGIGGGSADAAATSHALNALWRLNLSTDALAQIARPLGADVPVCIAGGSAWMTGAGETSVAMDLPTFAAVLINPLKPLATADVYREFDRMGRGGDLPNVTPPLWRDRTEALAGMRGLGNDLEAPARVLAPEIEEIARFLHADARVEYAALSGSGATMFAIVRDRDAACALAHAARTARTDWWVTDVEFAGAA